MTTISNKNTNNKNDENNSYKLYDYTNDTECEMTLERSIIFSGMIHDIIDINKSKTSLCNILKLPFINKQIRAALLQFQKECTSLKSEDMTHWITK